MANVVRSVAEILLRAHQADWGPASSDPKLQTPLTSKMVEDQLQKDRVLVEHYTVVGVLEDLAAQDYVALAPKAEDGSEERGIVKVYPARLKRDFNLWHIMEEA